MGAGGHGRILTGCLCLPMSAKYLSPALGARGGGAGGQRYLAAISGSTNGCARAAGLSSGTGQLAWPRQGRLADLLCSRHRHKPHRGADDISLRRTVDNTSITSADRKRQPAGLSRASPTSKLGRGSHLSCSRVGDGDRNRDVFPRFLGHGERLPCETGRSVR